METTSPESQEPQTPKQRFAGGKILTQIKNNLAFKSKWTAEINGALGDLGTFIPIVLTLTLAKELNLGTTLLFTGVYNIVIGAIYGVPMAVQPMKMIAAVALSTPDFKIPEIMAAGITTSAIIFFLGATGLMELCYRLIPLSVVRGVQLTQGLTFALTAVKYIRKKQDFTVAKSVGNRPWLGLDGLILALVCAWFIVIVNGAGEEKKKEEVEEEKEEDDDLEDGSKSRGNMVIIDKIRTVFFALPTALLIFLLGLALAVARGPPKHIANNFRFGPTPFSIVSISRKSWKEGFINGALPQLPLTILNSVIAVVKLSSDLFPGRGEFSTTSVSLSVGVMNLVGCWFGVMPCCVGAGGLAGQYKFGGRSGGCVALLGGVLLIIGVVFGGSIVSVFERFPVGVLGVLLLFAGIELAMAARDMSTKKEVFVMLICTAVSLFESGAFIGFVCGILVHLLLKLRYFEDENWNPMKKHNSN